MPMCRGEDEFGEYAMGILSGGSHWMCAGFSGNDAPRAVFPNLVGRRVKPQVARIQGMQLDRTFIGDDAVAKRGLLAGFEYPVVNGIVTDWELMEMVWRHAIFNELRVDPADLAVLVPQSVFTTRKHRQKMAEIHFESLGTRKISSQTIPELVMMCAARSSGIVVNCGAEQTTVCGIDGHASIAASACQGLIGGEHVTDLLTRLYNERNECHIDDRHLMQYIKEQKCGAALNATDARAGKLLQWTDPTFEYPNGLTIQLGSELSEATEILFTPTAGRPSVTSLIAQCVASLPEDLQDDAIKNIVLEGGTSLLPGFRERLAHDLQSHPTLLPDGSSLRVIAPAERKYSIWIGASILTSLSSFEASFVTKAMYDECGADSLPMV